MAEGTSVRRAGKADAGDVAVLVNIATHGLFADLRGRESNSGGTYSPIEIGRLQVLGDGVLSWRHANLAERTARPQA
jgi:hypothetical protein